MRRMIPLAASPFVLAACVHGPMLLEVPYDVLIRNGIVYDGAGKAGVRADVGVRGDRVVRVGDLSASRALHTVDATDLVVAPGFINILSQGDDTLLVDGRAMSDIKQGVTLEVLGEGESMGPLTAEMRARILRNQGDVKFEIPWTTLGEYLDHLHRRGLSPNVGSFVGAATVRVHEIGRANRAPTADELDRMRELVRHAMREGALGVSTALIYTPGLYAKTDELTALASVSGRYGGIYVSHIRSEGSQLMEALEELIAIARAAGVHAELYHMKAAGEANWPKMSAVIERIERARREGISMTANMYPYAAGATGLSASMPPWVQEGGLEEWIKRLRDPEIRARVAVEMRTPSDKWENLYVAAGSPERIILLAFKQDHLKPLGGKTLAEVARVRGKSAEETAMDLVIEDGSRVEAAYFLMSEANVRLGLSQPWVSICSDASALAPEGVLLKIREHPRAYGAFARFLGKYVRDEGVTTMGEAIHRMTQLPARTLTLHDRGCVMPGCFADIVVFDATQVRDHATFDDPHRYATGVKHLFVNGVQVLRDGEHTGAKPGRIVRGPGFGRD